MVGGNHLELGAPGQEILPREIREVNDLSIMGSGLLRQRPLAAAVIQGEVSALEHCELRPQGLDLGDQGFHRDIGRNVQVKSHVE